MADDLRKSYREPVADNGAREDRATLSICMRCRDGREDSHGDARGGSRLAAAVLRAGATSSDLVARGVHCMSQCKRSCVVALSGPGRFTYFFGDLDPRRDAAAVIALTELYRNSPDGFMARDTRPEPMQAGVIGRLPPLGWSGDAVTTLDLTPTTDLETNR